MPVSNALIQKGKDYLIHEGATFVLLFGSAAESPETARDLDLACEGIPPEKFFSVQGGLLLELNYPVDLVDLSLDNRFTRSIRSKGRVLYEA